MDNDTLALAAVIQIGREGRLNAKVLMARIGADMPRQIETRLQDLVRGGVLTSVRGAHGGYELAKPAGEISAAHVFEALEHESQAEPEDAPRPLIAARAALADADDVRKFHLRTVTIADLVEAAGPIIPALTPVFEAA